MKVKYLNFKKLNKTNIETLKHTLKITNNNKGKEKCMQNSWKSFFFLKKWYVKGGDIGEGRGFIDCFRIGVCDRCGVHLPHNREKETIVQ